MADKLKLALRKTYKQLRKKLPASYQQKMSSKVCRRVVALEQYRYAKRIGFYMPINGEVDLTPLWRSASLQGKYCYFPALTSDKTLDFLPATPATRFKKNRYQVDEPDISQQQAINPEQLDVIFVPLVAFDTRGTRLGMGAGYYDRTLANCRPPLLIGIAYDFQRVDYIFAAPWDIPLHAVITELNIFWSNS